MVTGNRYLGNFICDRGVEATWLEDKVEGWEALVSNLLGVDCKHPQTDKDGM